MEEAEEEYLRKLAVYEYAEAVDRMPSSVRERGREVSNS